MPAAAAGADAASIDESLALRRRWDGRADGRLRAAFAPRFAVSCSRALLEAVARLCRSGERVIVHTHASENRDEIEVVRRLSGGLSNLEYLARHRAGDAAPLHRALRLGDARASRRCSPSATSR